MEGQAEVIDVEGIRTCINEIDRRLVELLAERSSYVHLIRNIRTVHGEPLRDRAREHEIIDKADALNKALRGRYSTTTIALIFQAIFDGCEHLDETSLPRSDHAGDRRAAR